MFVALTGAGLESRPSNATIGSGVSAAPFVPIYAFFQHTCKPTFCSQGTADVWLLVRHTRRPTTTLLLYSPVQHLNCRIVDRRKRRRWSLIKINLGGVLRPHLQPPIHNLHCFANSAHQSMQLLPLLVFGLRPHEAHFMNWFLTGDRDQGQYLRTMRHAPAQCLHGRRPYSWC